MSKQNLDEIKQENLLESFIQECLNLATNNPLQKAINSTRYALNQSQFLRGIINSENPHETTFKKLESNTRSKAQISHLKIAIVGQFSSGKSSFLNALLGAEILPSGVTPITAKVCEISYRENIDFVQNLATNDAQNLPPNSLQNLPQNLLQNLLIEVHYKDSSVGLKPLSYLHQIDSIENATISHFKLNAPLDLLKDITFLDTPGFNSQNQIDTDTTNEILEQVDGIIWLSLIDNVGKQSEKDILETHLKKYAAKSLCILNQKDRLKNEAEIATSLAYANSAFSGFFAEIIAISAKQALDSHSAKNKHEKQNLWADSNMQAVLDFIQNELRAKTSAIKTKKVLRDLESLLVKEAFRTHRSLNLRFWLLDILKKQAALMRFRANQSDLSARFDTLFPQLNSKLDSLAQYIFNSQVLKQISYKTTQKNALGLSKITAQEKSVMMLEKDTLKSELTKSENPFCRDLVKIGFMINDFGKSFREFLCAQEAEFIATLQAWQNRACAYENIHAKSLQVSEFLAGQDFGEAQNPTNDLQNNLAKSSAQTSHLPQSQTNIKSISSFLAALAKEYALLQEGVLATLEREVSNLKNILTLEYQNAIELTLESLDNKMNYALKKHLENPSEFEPFALTLENVRECLNQGLHFLLFQDKLLLINALYKTTLFSLSEKLNDFYEAKSPLLQSQINALIQSKNLLLRQRHALQDDFSAS